MEKVIEVSRNGWNYTLWVNEQGKITHIQCAYRFPKTEPRFIGDDWIVEDLQSYVDSLE